jgi:hypothetical protein
MAAAFANATEIIETSDANTITVTPPASLAAGNMWPIFLAWDTDSGSSIATPSGFTKIGSDIVGADDGWPQCVLFQKIAGASEGNVIITRTGGDNYHRVAYSIRVTGDGTLEIDAVGTPITPTGEGTVIDAPNIAIAQDGSLALLFGASVGTPTFGTTMAAPAGATLRDSRVGDNVYSIAAFATQAVNAGAFSPGNWTWGASADLNTNRIAQTISIKDIVAAEGRRQQPRNVSQAVNRSYTY